MDQPVSGAAPEDSSSIVTTPFEQVISACKAFTEDCKPGAAPSIGAYLAQVPEDAQPTLLRNLLAIEVERRRAAGEQPNVEEYLARFPRYADLIRDAFLQLSSASDRSSSGWRQGAARTGKFLEPSTGAADAARTPSPPPQAAAARMPAASRLGEYRLLRELGRGGMGVVYEAVHLQRGNRVALKTLPTLDGTALHLFKREFRAVAGVNHPNLIGLHTLEADGGQWFFTMDLVEGVTFLAYVRPHGMLDEPRLRSALAQLVTGVMALHGQHIIHRDLKPSNVLVTHDGQVVVLDFGLVLELDGAGATGRSTHNIAGTPKYMAPEQAAAGRIVPASDWYAVGVMVYEALAGRAPFSGPLLQVLQDKQRLDPPPLPDDGNIPADLAALCLRLLARDPQQRPDVFAIARAVASSEPAAAAVTPAGQHLVGRDQHLAALKDGYRALQRERAPVTLFITGRSGEGKTTLGEHFLTQLRADKGLAVMSGRCYDRESVPFKALDTLIDALAGYLRALPGEDAALLMPDDIGVLVQVFPVLQRVEVVARAAADARLAELDEQQVRQRAFRALRALLSRIGRRSPVVWLIDDLQWGDADSAEALFEVLRPPEAPAVLFLGSYRSDETEGSAFLRMWKELQRKHAVPFADREVKVGPLTVAECTELVVRLLGRDGDSVRRRAAEFAQETRGNPFLLTELVGCFDPDTDSFEPLPLHEVLARKLGRLPAEAGRLLEVVAVSGQGLALEEASRTAGHALPPVATITRMRNERLVRLVGPEESPLIDTYHDRVRETVLGRMEQATCQALHRTLAEVIEKGVGGVSAEVVAALESGEKQEAPATPRVYDLAYHFDAAGEKRKAWLYALLAAEQARRQSALEVAVQQYAIAGRNAGEMADAVRYRIAEGCGEALMLLGRYADANGQLDGAIDLVEDVEKKARIEVLQGEIAFKQGALNRSIACYERGLRRLGHCVPRTRLGFGYRVLREAAVQCWHSLLPWRLHRQPPSSQLALTIRFFNRISQPYIFQSTLKLLWAHLSGMNRAELLPPAPQLAFTYGAHNVVMAMLGWQARGSRYGDRASALARAFDDLWGYAHSCNYQGIGHYASARYEEGLARLTEAISSFEKTGDLWQLNLAHFHRACCHFGLGDLAEAVAEARWVSARSARLGDSWILCSSYLWARATRGNIPFEELQSCYPCRPDDIMSTALGVMAEGHWHSFHGRSAEALKTYERAGEIVRQSGGVNSQTILVLPVLAGALRLHADAVQVRGGQQAARLRQRAYRLATWATRVTRFFPAAYPQALRERSLILAAYGKTWQALKFADKSCAVAESQKAKYEFAQSLFVRGKLAHQLGLPEAEQQIRAAEAALDAIERPVRAEAGHVFPSPTEMARPDSPPQELHLGQPPRPAEAPAPPQPGSEGGLLPRLRRTVLAGSVVLVAAVLVGHLAGTCTGYVVGSLAGALAGDQQARAGAGADLGAAVGRVAFPVVSLLGWGLLRWGWRHHDAAVRKAPRERPSPPPAPVRYGLALFLGVFVLGLGMIPPAVGIWLGGAVADAFGGAPGPWATALSGLGGVLGLGLPFLLWRRAQ
jgi:tetratricopeptide (TPR) repeat protein